MSVWVKIGNKLWREPGYHKLLQARDKASRAAAGSSAVRRTAAPSGKSLPPAPDVSTGLIADMSWKGAFAERDAINRWLKTESRTPGILSSEQQTTKLKLERRLRRHEGMDL